jgi:uncharacterized protein (TIGR04562 family)
MNVLIGGLSSIDLPEIEITDKNEATLFLRSYGYDPDRANDARFIHAIIIEALAFIERNLMSKEWRRGLTPPTEILNCDDARDLLLWACDRRSEFNVRGMWACAILRVMHTIAHIEGAFRYSDIDVARDEIMSRLQGIITQSSDGRKWLVHGNQRIELERFEWKNKKSRESVLLKLLHKRANVAETIYDMLGVRIVIKEAAEVLLAVKLLYKSHVISFPNAIPTRSRNSFVDLDRFRMDVDLLRGSLATGHISPADFIKQLDLLTIHPPETDKENPHTGEEYRAIQLTCRQLIRTARPLSILRKNLEVASQSLDRMKEESSSTVIDEIGAVLQNISRIAGDDEFSFFPFEVQIMDSKSYVLNTTGSASHTKYKKSQVKAARRRVLSEILPLS